MGSEIVKQSEAPRRIGGFSSGLAAKKKAALEQGVADGSVDARTVPTAPPLEMPDRIGIIFDDSISMHGQAIKDAQEGTVEFLRCCKPTTTSVAIYSMNYKTYKLCTTLPALGQLVQSIDATGSTPMFGTMRRLHESEPVNRMILFSDGAPTDEGREEEVLAAIVEAKIPVDTVYIADEGAPDARAESTMKRIAERTGGIFMKFERGKTTFKNSFKYLAPATRALLMDEATRKKVERGEAII